MQLSGIYRNRLRASKGHGSFKNFEIFEISGSEMPTGLCSGSWREHAGVCMLRERPDFSDMPLIRSIMEALLKRCSSSTVDDMTVSEKRGGCGYRSCNISVLKPLDTRLETPYITANPDQHSNYAGVKSFPLYTQVTKMTPAASRIEIPDLPE